MVNFFSKEDKKQIVDAIRSAEKETTGEIRVHVKRKCGEDTLAEAHKVFRKLGMHRTKQKNAVLIFLAPGSRRFAILGDEGIHHEVRDDFWNGARDLMAGHFGQGRFRDGVLAAIRETGEKLKKHFPSTGRLNNELPDNVTED